MVRHFKAGFDALITRLDYLSIEKTTDGVFTYGMTWIEIQDAINWTLSELFLAEGSRPDVMRISVNDDKVQFNMKTASMQEDGEYLFGMKLCQHITSNCRGMTIDSAVSSTTGYSLHFSVIRQGESNIDNYKRCYEAC